MTLIKKSAFYFFYNNEARKKLFCTWGKFFNCFVIIKCERRTGTRLHIFVATCWFKHNCFPIIIHCIRIRLSGNDFFYLPWNDEDGHTLGLTQAKWYLTMRNKIERSLSRKKILLCTFFSSSRNFLFSIINVKKLSSKCPSKK